MNNDTTKQCTECKRYLPATRQYFHKQKLGKYGLRSQCRECTSKLRGHKRFFNLPFDTPDGYRECSKCHRILEATTHYFYKEKQGRDGLCSICKDCRAIDLGAKRHRIILPEGQKQCCRCKLIYPTTTDYFHKDKHIRHDGLASMCKICSSHKNKRHRQIHKLRLNARERELWKIKEKGKRYKHQIAIKNARRRARLSKNGGQHSAQDITKQLAMQNYRCWWCGCKLESKYHIDHRIPLARGGSNSANNIVMACPSCNLSKGAKTPDEWIGRLL